MSAPRPLAQIADAALEATVVGSFSRIGFAARRALFAWDDQPPTDLSGRVAVVTGATSGIGLATAHALAQRRAQLWIVGRDANRTQAACDEIAASHPEARINTVIADLARLDDVRECAATVARETSRLDVLVHNAGALTHELRYSEDGIELTAQVHVVAPFLLTTALLPALRATPDARVITVSSGGMYTQRLDVDALARPASPFDGVRVYANAKRAQVVLNEEWTHQPAAAGVTFAAMHPGWADTAGVQAALPRFRRVMRPILRTPAQAADTVVWLAGAAEAPASNGGFWLDRRRRSPNHLPWTRTAPAEARILWAWTAERAGVDAAAWSS